MVIFNTLAIETKRPSRRGGEGGLLQCPPERTTVREGGREEGRKEETEGTERRREGGSERERGRKRERGRERLKRFKPPDRT